jgi:hypothetical protein
MKAHTNQTNEAAQQDYSERLLQLLCLIAQSLARIESHLGIAKIPQQQRPNKIIAFNAGGRR